MIHLVLTIIQKGLKVPMKIKTSQLKWNPDSSPEFMESNVNFMHRFSIWTILKPQRINLIDFFAVIDMIIEREKSCQYCSHDI
jgi:hypothetical protein